MSKVEDFLSTAQEGEIIEAIRVAEKHTSGEIRVHLEKSTTKDPLERAKEVFCFLKMDATEAHNGVLFYVAVDDKKFSILGDSGIDKAVPDTFWNHITALVQTQFKKNNYTEGLKLGIEEAGKKLKEYFPYDQKDKNELPNTISSN